MNDPRQEDESAIYALPIEDENAPDLYIPLVSFLTFALVTAYVKGQSGSFTPEVLAQIITSCAGFQMFELVLYSTGLYISGAGAPLLDLTCYTGYKYVSLCFNMLATALGSDSELPPPFLGQSHIYPCRGLLRCASLDFAFVLVFHAEDDGSDCAD